MLKISKITKVTKNYRTVMRILKIKLDLFILELTVEIPYKFQKTNLSDKCIKELQESITIAKNMMAVIK
jgi:hypothetical protein